ncbi:hypothetical protein S245_036366, partial [Arachis hypogaea]
MDRIHGRNPIAEINGLCFIDLIKCYLMAQEPLKAMEISGGISPANLTEVQMEKQLEDHVEVLLNLKVSGLKIQNSTQFHMIFNGCQGVQIDRLSISSPKLSPNTDGDDRISIGPGTANVDIDGVTCGPSHGISFLSLKNESVTKSFL